MMDNIRQGKKWVPVVSSRVGPRAGSVALKVTCGKRLTCVPSQASSDNVYIPDSLKTRL